MRLRVVSWNVGRLYSPKGNNRLEDSAIPLVCKTLHEIQPDVILLQELVDEGQLHRLVSALEYKGDIARECGYDRHVAVLVRPPLEPEFRHHRLHPTPRGVVTAHFRVDGNWVAASSIHFDILSRPRRLAQATALRKLMREHDEDTVVLFGGDFNYDPSWAVGMRDVSDQRTYSLLTENHNDLGLDSGPTLLGLLRLDHLFMRTPFDMKHKTYVSPHRLPLGDHHPLVCDLHAAATVQPLASQKEPGVRRAKTLAG